MIRIFLSLICFLTASVSYLFSCDNLKTGFFEIYEDGVKVGHIYRVQDFQIEKYLDDTDDMVTRIKSDGCLFYMKSYHVKKDLDTITWAVTYEKIGDNHYSYVGKPEYLEIDYNRHGEIKKISDDIPSDVLKVFENLKSKDNN